MKFAQPLVPARLERRYKRFLADAILKDGTKITAHCANSGAMLGCAPAGARIWLSPNTNPKAKLDWRWELVEVDDTLVGINTAHPNRIVETAIMEDRISELTGYQTLRREVAYGASSRIDLLAQDHPDRPGQNCYIEVKNVTLRQDGEARFPDAVTARGTKHLMELADMVRQGHRAVMLYLVQRDDCDQMALAHEIDPAYARAFSHAVEQGVEAYAYACSITLDHIRIAQPLPIRPPASYP
ncbi:sugar fermentation stimulation protein [Iodidimonas gelatinilytica]|uniref:Sugar fermentation stimulation protein homolog n=1 Tax=Iodidimonas gelatinilytica TaxID=1236966 RepID=A0A5A7N0U0_9PROT|nr:DNA/RNA nuclease SfsA [Iodidimonas gelatinilytica]GEQ98165.1 sugar fermentation stimulation protein [Iodidimonas gelatinilytica]GER00676.1 sugar fermentation stimulation protein [Iodidimonas gelatinilytica]